MSDRYPCYRTFRGLERMVVILLLSVAIVIDREKRRDVTYRCQRVVWTHSEIRL